MPSAIKHDEELAGKGLVTILVEAQGANEAQLEHFLWKTFPDNECFSCVGVQVPLPPSDGIPHGGLIGVDGTLLWAGNPLDATKKINELIEAELAKVKKGWGDSAEARKVRAALYGKGDLNGANDLVAAMAEGEERTKLQAEVDARYASLKGAIKNLQDQGRWLEAQSNAKSLAKGVGNHATWAGEMSTVLAEFDSDAGKAELAADKKLEKAIKLLRDKKLDAAPKALAAVTKAGGDTKVAARATKIQTALDTELK